MCFLLKLIFENFIALTEQVKYLSQCVEKLLQRNQPYGIPGPSRIGSQDEPIILSDDEVVIKSEKIDAATSMDKKTVSIEGKASSEEEKEEETDSAEEKVISEEETVSAEEKASNEEETFSDQTTRMTPIRPNIKTKGKAPIRPTSIKSKRKTLIRPTNIKSKGKTPIRPTNIKSKRKTPIQSTDNKAKPVSPCSSGEDSSNNSDSTNSLIYLNKNDMPKDLREALRVSKDITLIGYKFIS